MWDGSVPPLPSLSLSLIMGDCYHLSFRNGVSSESLNWNIGARCASLFFYRFFWEIVFSNGTNIAGMVEVSFVGFPFPSIIIVPMHWWHLRVVKAFSILKFVEFHVKPSNFSSNLTPTLISLCDIYIYI